MSNARSHTRSYKKHKAKMVRAQWRAARRRGWIEPWNTWTRGNTHPWKPR